MGFISLVAALAVVAAAPQDDARESAHVGGKVSAQPHTAKPAMPPAPHPARPVTPAAPARPTPPPAGEVQVQREHHLHDRLIVPWVPLRVYQGVDEVQLQGPGAVTPVENADPVDDAVVGNWRLKLPTVAAAEDGYGRVDTFREAQDLGSLQIVSSGTYEWDVPGSLRATGNLVEVTADKATDEHFWMIEGHGRRMVIAPGDNGNLVLYDADTNHFYARAVRD